MTRTLYSEDCLHVLNDEAALPTGSVDLIYLDPPFNSNSKYNLPFEGKYKNSRPVQAFKDTWEWGNAEEDFLKDLSSGPSSRLLADIVRLAKQIERGKVKNSLAAYLINMAVRLIPMQRALSPKGSIYLHCDPTASHYLKLIMDVIFGRDFFRNEVIWHYGLGGSSHNYYSRKHDVILFYTKDSEYYFDKPQVPATSNRMKGEMKGATDVWDIPSINNMAKERLGYPTQKPLDLLLRIVEASSRKGDFVLDPFCGCGTAVHAAEKLGRNWAGIDISTFATGLIRERVVRNFEEIDLDDVEIIGNPLTVADAMNLAKRDKFEFEKWVCGQVGAEGLFHNPGDRGADGGVDGVLKFYPLKMALPLKKSLQSFRLRVETSRRTRSKRCTPQCRKPEPLPE